MVRGVKSHVKALTGHEPQTCPWRAFYDPLVDKVVGAVVAAREGYAPAMLGDDPPGIVIDGMRLYTLARNATDAHDRKEERKRREAENAARRNRR